MRSLSDYIKSSIYADETEKQKIIMIFTRVIHKILLYGLLMERIPIVLINLVWMNGKQQNPDLNNI